MLQTIAATTSRTGLTVHAELDSGHCPTGIQISDEAVAALPITRHRFHGDWNYTLHTADRRPRPDRPQRNRSPAGGSHSLMPDELQHPELTGMTRQHFSDLVNTLIPELEEHREQARHAARGGPRRVARGTGRKPTLTPAEQILVTILYLRKHALQELLGQLFNTTAMTISRAVKDVRPLIGATDGDGQPGASRFGGLPWLGADEPWPRCADCAAPLTFFVQLDLAGAPKQARDLGTGLLQLFHCTACNPYRAFSGGHLVRVVDAAGQASSPTPPDGVPLFPERPIAGWARAVRDYPYREADESELLPEERAAVFGLNRQGDKLGGWPNWVQDPGYPNCPRGDHRMTQPVLQIDSGRGVPHVWGDYGAGYIVQCPTHRDQVAFLVAVGVTAAVDVRRPEGVFGELPYVCDQLQQGRLVVEDSA